LLKTGKTNQNLKSENVKREIGLHRLADQFSWFTGRVHQFIGQFSGQLHCVTKIEKWPKNAEQFL
jgi:hypothetical protein